MKNFRIAECLDKDGIHEYAIFADRSRKKRIYEDEEYGKYFEVDNELNNEISNILKFSFTGRIKDAVDMIKAGSGDCIKSSNLFGGRHIKVVYFLNREVGEELRKKSLEGWRDTAFGWIVEAGNKCSFSGYAPINKKGERISCFDEERTPITFSTKAAAEEYANEIITKAASYAKRIASQAKGENEVEEEKAIEAIFDEIDESTGTKCSLLSDFVYDMLTDYFQLKSPECSLNKWGCRIAQYAIANEAP